MKAVYVKAPFQFSIKEVALRAIKQDEVLLKVKACSVCGHDMIMAAYGAEDWQPFGHEVSGVVEQVGGYVQNVKVGDSVVLESGTFDRFSDNSRNGRVDLDNKGPNFWVKDDDTMGFAEYIIVPMEVCVKFEGLSFEEACVIEPMGVALDLVKTADIKLNNDVLVIGLGPIGLMAAKMAKAMGARKVYGSDLSTVTARIELAKNWGVDEIISPDKEKLEDYPFAKGGVDRVLVSAPPKTIPTGLNVCNMGGIVAFLGIDYGPEGQVTFDSNIFHVNKLQLRSSFASPALYFPECIDLIKSGVVQTKDLITHKFSLDEISSAIPQFRDDKDTAIKAVMING
ncbi:MAG: alcohol dehydrogenase catalytic domain-containing protein [Bacteroidetes bacterium]|nr:alcohol dehydrogenase catalytic domain-containing protein [Bacteroidota bacterium]